MVIFLLQLVIIVLQLYQVRLVWRHLEKQTLVTEPDWEAEREKLRLDVQRYWQLVMEEWEKPATAEQLEAFRKEREVLRQSIKKRIASPWEE